MKDKWEVILKVAGEGGSIRLEGIKDGEGRWVKYRKRINELLDYFGELEDEGEKSKEIEADFDKLSVHTLEEALDSLDRRRLAYLHPMHVHPEFSMKFFNEVKNLNLDRRKMMAWKKICFPSDQAIGELALLMKESKYTVVLTGAGMDTESNIPDFRSQNGWWRNLDPRKVASTESLYNNYSLFHEFYTMRIKALENCYPHRGHYILSDLEQKGFIQCIATQNVSGLHRKAGSQNVYELHGSIKKIRCNECGHVESIDEFMNNKRCQKCDSEALRPDVTLFGEMLPQKEWNITISHIKKADLVIVIGTSLEVYPANQLPNMTKGKVVLINAEDVRGNYNFDMKITGKAKEILQELVRHL